MKKILMFLMAMAFAVAMPACDALEDLDPDKELELEGGGTEQAQVFYADEADETGGFAFYAPAPWTASVNYSTASRAEGWLRLTVGGVETMSGAAGNHTLMIEMEANDTNTTRSATIEIECGGTRITVTVTQDARTVDEAKEEGDYEERPEKPAPTYLVTVENGTASHATAKEGTVVTLTPNAPKTDYEFTGWTVVEGNITIENNRFTMPAHNVSVRGEFSESEAINPGGHGPGIPPEGCRLVSRMTSSWLAEDTGEREESTLTFEYDDLKRLVGVTSQYSDGDEFTVTYNYHGDRIFASETYMSESEYSDGKTTRETETCQYVLLAEPFANGWRVVSATEEWDNGQTDSWHANYREDGHMDASIWEDFDYKISWSNGNMIEFYSGENEDKSTLEYGNVANNPLCNIDFNWMTVYSDFAPNVAGLIKLLGKPNANMASKKTEYRNGNYTMPEGVETYTYETDKQGFVTKITCKSTYDGGIDDESSIITIEYLN